jgi:large repetitive protein
VNTDQRRIELCGTQAGAACAPSAGSTYSYSVTIPTDPGIALPGNWMVFGVDKAGVYSVSQTVKVGTAPAAAAATATLRAAGPTTAGTSNSDTIVVAQKVTPIAPQKPMPPGTQLD